MIPRPLLLVLLLCLGAPAWAQAPAGVGTGDPDLLNPEQAFRFQVLSRGRVLRLEVQVADGYYLYRDRIRLTPRTPGLALGEPLKPTGESKNDPVFGPVQVYRGRTTIELPVTAAPADARTLSVAVTSQGCADVGVCYPPETRVLQVARPAVSAVGPVGAPGTEQALSALARLGQAFGSGEGEGAAAGSGGETEFLPVDEAFRVRASAAGDGTVTVSFDIAGGYYLYRSRMGFRADSPAGAVAADATLPEGKVKVDSYFGEQQVYYGSASAAVPVRGAPPGARVELAVSYQGCADAGLCYPPQERLLPVTLAGAAASPLAAGRPAARPVPDTLSETDRLARSLIRDGLGWVLGTFFVAGLLLAFTPCVLPMIPILSAIIAGQGDGASPRHGFTLSVVYVLAMSLTYTAAGVVAGLFGQNLQAVFQHPAVLVGFSLVFVALALAMFGLYELQLPVALQSRLAVLSHRQRGGSFVGVGLMGMLSALIVGPCVAAPLAAALIAIGSTGDPVRGGLALFALSLGMGVPLLAVGVFGPTLLPRAGAWMTLVRNVFGIMLLAVAVYLLSRLLPDSVTLALWAALCVLTAVVVMLSGRGASPRRGGALRVAAGVGALAYAVVLAVGAATGASDPLRPLEALGRGQPAGLQFQRIKTVADLERVIARANAGGHGVMLDFYADWCVSCKEMEHDTFTDPAVHAALSGLVLVQADVTVYDADDQALLARFGLPGPPAILFFGRDGNERRGLRIIGYMDAASFGPHVARARRS